VNSRLRHGGATQVFAERFGSVARKRTAEPSFYRWCLRHRRGTDLLCSKGGDARRPVDSLGSWCSIRGMSSAIWR
jgi:hypothetical protein